MSTVDKLAEAIRRIDGNHDMGAGALAEALTAEGWVQISDVAPSIERRALESAQRFAHQQRLAGMEAWDNSDSELGLRSAQEAGAVAGWIQRYIVKEYK